MAIVNTVTGPLDTDDLGFTLSHEHVGTNAAGLRHTFPEFIDRDGIREQSIVAMTAAYADGVRTMVDVSTIDLGRDVGLIKEVSEGSGIQIIVATGNHVAVPRPFADVSPDVIAALYIREIEEGIEGTGIKAGIIKVASDRGGITPPQEVVLRAAARTQKATGIPISTHTWSPDRVGEQQVAILEEEGVDLTGFTSVTATTTPTWIICLACSTKESGWGWIGIRAGRFPVLPIGKNAPR